MPRNGSGSYSLPSGNPVVTGTAISSTVQNNTMSDIATALTASIAKDGQTTATANLPMGGFKHTGAANGSAATDYATIANVQNGTGIYISTVGGTADVITLTPSPAIGSYVAGQFFSFISSGANTTNVTVNISSLGAKAITKNGATALVAGDIPSGALISIIYDGTQFQLQTSANLNALSSITGLGTGVATALAVNVGSAGAPVTFNGALGTPSSGTLTNCTNSTVSGTSQATTSGTQFDFTGLPAGIKRITVSFSNVSMSGTDNIIVQIGDSGGFETSGYVSTCGAFDVSFLGIATSTAGFLIVASGSTRAFSGSVCLTLIDSSTFSWVSSVAGCLSTIIAVSGGGHKSLSAEITQVRVTRTGADTFDSGTVNILYER